MKFVPRSETTRQFIIEACAPVFNKKGLAGTSVTDMEKATNLTKGSIYGNFENKDAVALAVFDYNLENKRSLIQEKVDRSVSYKDKLLAHVLAHDPAAKTPFTPGGCPMQNTAIEADDTHEELRKRAADGLLRWKQDMADLIKKGITAKEFKADTDVSGTALHIISLIEGGALIAKATRNMQHAKKILDIAIGVVNDIAV
jgi:TetR/AcrR family transcriptional repressor of nem operon